MPQMATRSPGLQASRRSSSRVTSTAGREKRKKDGCTAPAGVRGGCAPSGWAAGGAPPRGWRAHTGVRVGEQWVWFQQLSAAGGGPPHMGTWHSKAQWALCRKGQPTRGQTTWAHQGCTTSPRHTHTHTSSAAWLLTPNTHPSEAAAPGGPVSSSAAPPRPPPWAGTAPTHPHPPECGSCPGGGPVSGSAAPPCPPPWAGPAPSDPPTPTRARQLPRGRRLRQLLDRDRLVVNELGQPKLGGQQVALVVLGGVGRAGGGAGVGGDVPVSRQGAGQARWGVGWG